MKTIITYEFDLNDSEDKISRLIHTDDAYMTLNDFMNHLKNEYKYNDTYSTEVYDYIEKLKEKLFEIMDLYNINLDRDFS